MEVRAEPGRVRSQGGRGGKGREDPRGRLRSRLRCPGNSAPTAPSRPGRPKGGCGPAAPGASPGGAFAPIPLRQGSISRGAARCEGAGGPASRRGSLFWCFRLFVWFGFPTLDDAATATQCLTHLRLNLKEVYFSNGVFSVNRRF